MFKATRYIGNIELCGKTVEQQKPTSYNSQIILSGYFQYYPIIKNHEADIRSYFKSVMTPYVKAIESKYETENAGFIHIRRGDYKNKSHYHFLQPIDYYESAFQKIKDKISNRFYILTDDPLWVQDQDLFKKDNFTLFEGNELESLALMSLCKSAAICANSTFSWWGAFLGAYEMRNPVIVPKKWIDEPNAENLIPEGWVII